MLKCTIRRNENKFSHHTSNSEGNPTLLRLVQHTNLEAYWIIRENV